jgi:hypothetical protein
MSPRPFVRSGNVYLAGAREIWSQKAASPASFPSVSFPNRHAPTNSEKGPVFKLEDDHFHCKIENQQKMQIASASSRRSSM